MITYHLVRQTDLPRLLPSILRLINRHHDKHITRKAYLNVKRLTPTDLKAQGTAIVTAWAGKRLVGVIVCQRFGVQTSMMVVDREYRSKGIAKELLKQATYAMGKFYGEVAADNLASLRACFGMGLVAYDVFLRRGKITLRVKNGFPVEDSNR